jgi:hypothetical protein
MDLEKDFRAYEVLNFGVSGRFCSVVIRQSARSISLIGPLIGLPSYIEQYGFQDDTHGFHLAIRTAV